MVMSPHEIVPPFANPQPIPAAPVPPVASIVPPLIIMLPQETVDPVDAFSLPIPAAPYWLIAFRLPLPVMVRVDPGPPIEIPA